MTADYADPDWEVVDYHIYCLDSNLLDRQTKTPLRLRGPAPQSLETGRYFVCLGAAQTFGRFCEEPYPTVLQRRLGIPAINFGRGGAGPSFFLNDNRKLMDYVNGARFAVVQIMAGRSESNSLFESKGLGHYTRRSDGTEIGCDQAFKELLEEKGEAYTRKIVAETRHNWVNNYVSLLEAIRTPKILLWLSERHPLYKENYNDVYALFGQFPQLVNADMITQLIPYADDYVECVSTTGMPHILINRFTGEPTTVEDVWTGTWRNNWYYPSPAMHIEAANALDKACRKYMRPPRTGPRSSTFFDFGKRMLNKALLRSK